MACYLRAFAACQCASCTRTCSCVSTRRLGLACPITDCPDYRREAPRTLEEQAAAREAARAEQAAQRPPEKPAKPVQTPAEQLRLAAFAVRGAPRPPMMTAAEAFGRVDAIEARAKAQAAAEAKAREAARDTGGPTAAEFNRMLDEDLRALGAG